MYSLLKKSKLRWIQSLLLTISEALSYMLIPLVQKKVLDNIVNKDFSKLNLLIFYMLSLYLLHYIFQIIRSYFDVKLSTLIKTEYQKDVYNRMLNSNISNITKNKVGKLMTIMGNDIDTVSTYLSSTLKLLTYNIIIVIFLLAVMVKLSLLITILIVGIFCFIYYFNSFHKNKYKNYKLEIQKNKENFSELLNQSILAFKMIQSNNLKGYFNKKLLDILEKDKEVNVRSIVFSNVLGALTKYTFTGGRVLIFFIAIIQIKSGKMTIGTLLALLSYYEFMYNPILQFKNFLETKAKTEESYSRIEKIFEENKEFFKGKELYSKFESLEFKNMSFSYEEKEIYKNFNYKIKSRDKIAIIGENGKGKSTLINILTGLEKITSGNILINNKNFYDLNIDSYRENISVLFQENNLFDLSIEENLKMGNEKIERNQIESVCKTLGIHKLISSLSEGYETKLKHLGTNFSGGEKRKILLAKTFLKDSDIYIFDELTSNLDIDSRENLLNLIIDLFQDKTILFITHNSDEVSKFNRILNLNKL